ncbi:M24 family metallopeptidase [Thalassotalea atypica]|uniref:M24 family metallopeptidase n=1 Tax=Thalassotalea atypica TaxID=2054316 RepID=UPI002573339A|nr:Xaa-Pro peptidase family protein [Thalassotalea atypica]
MNRIEKLRTTLNLEKLNSFLIFNDHNITYLTGFNGHAATILLTPLHNYLITDYRYYEQAKTQAVDMDIVCRDRVNQSLPSLINELLIKEQVSELAFESAHCSVEQWQSIHQGIQVNTVIGKTRLVEDLRYVKDDSEIASIAQAADIADQALAITLTHIQDGMCERDLALELDYQMAKLGSEGTAFDTILLFGERSALPHGIPGNRKLKRGDLVLIDFGARINGYRSDMTRTYVFGEASPKQKEVYQIVQQAQQAALDTLTEGITGERLYQSAADVLTQSPYAQYMGEGLGHGLGLDLHEFPIMGAGCDLTIYKGSVITIEPGIYIPNWGGIRIEDDVVLTDNGLSILNKAPKALLEL